MADTVRAALDLCSERNVLIPNQVFRELLSSQDVGKRFVTLEHLVEHGEARHLPLVAPLKGDDSPSIAELAQAFVRKFEKE